MNTITGTLYLQNLQGHLEDLSHTTLENTKKVLIIIMTQQFSKDNMVTYIVTYTVNG